MPRMRQAWERIEAARCAECGEIFWRQQRKDRTPFCSNRCCKRHSYTLQPSEMAICKGCGEQFTRKQRVNRTPFCSNACRHSRVCEQCGVAFLSWAASRRFCSRLCRVLATAIPWFMCQQCGVLFKPLLAKYSRFCCKPCSDQHNHEQGRFRRSLRGELLTASECVAEQALVLHYRRRRDAAIRRRVEVTEPIRSLRKRELLNDEGVRFSRNDVLERDGWRCQMCGCKTRPDWNAHHPKYPNLDHIVPLSKGGSHTPENTQCLCKQCNIKKGDRLIRQVRVAV